MCNMCAHFIYALLMELAAEVESVALAAVTRYPIAVPFRLF